MQTYPAWDLIVDGPRTKTEDIKPSIPAAYFPVHCNPITPKTQVWSENIYIFYNVVPLTPIIIMQWKK